MAPQMQDDMSEAKERYILPNDWEEINRMYHQHEWVKSSAGGLVKAPVNLNKRGLRVLDAATADGIWLNDARSIFPEDATLLGFDIAPELYLPVGVRAPNVQLVVQDLAKPFPQDWEASFDLVHQRFILPSFNDELINTVLSNLISCVRPGGYIQIVEPDVTARVSDPRAEAFENMQKISERVMNNPNATPKVLDFFKKSGLVEIGLETFDMVVGDKAPNREAGIQGRKNFGFVMGKYMQVCKPQDFGMDQKQWNTFQTDFEDDTRLYKTAIRQNFIWAKKPEQH